MLTRRTLLSLAAWGATGPAGAAPFQSDGPARVRPLAAKGVLLDLALAGSRLVAVGERGHVLLSDDAGKAWRQAKVVPTRATLTALHATDATRLWAVGHGGVILHSTDAGDTWALATGQAAGPEVLLAVRVQADGQGLAVGSFGTALHTLDGGRHWQAKPLLPGEAGERHLNRILVTPAGTWLVAAEGGQVLRAAGAAPLPSKPWEAVKTPYAGSLWTGQLLGSGVVLLGGMRGNLVRSSDDGRSWTHLPVREAGSFTGSTLLPDGRPVLVGVDGTVVIGDAAGQQFSLQRQPDRGTLTAVVAVAVDGAGLVAASTAGLRTLALPT